MVPIVKLIFTEEESKEILEFLKEKAYVYHRPYKRYNKMVKVPRGARVFYAKREYSLQLRADSWRVATE